MKFVDLFAGIGGFRLGLERTGHECVASCEIAKFPRRVYAHHWEEPCFDDVTKIQPADLPSADLWCGGFPCQDASSAGKGLGLLGGKRSSLVFRVLGLAAVARPEWLLLENVPGLLVRGRGFGRLTALLDRIGYVGEWRTLDAQFFQVAQRRSRVLLVARRARAPGGRPPALLLESASMCGPAPTRQAEGAGVARTLSASLGGSGAEGSRDTFIVHAPQVAPPLLRSSGHHGHSSPRGDGSTPLVAGFNSEATSAETLGCAGDLSPPVRAGSAHVGVCAWGFDSKQDGRGAQAETSPPILAAGHAESHAHGGAPPGVCVVPFNAAQITSPHNRTRCAPGDPAPTLAASGEPASVCARGLSGAYVRRLTPKECERLQGFPDDWTAISGAKDGPRYRALGNSVAVPVIEWVGKRLRYAEVNS